MELGGRAFLVPFADAGLSSTARAPSKLHELGQGSIVQIVKPPPQVSSGSPLPRSFVAVAAGLSLAALRRSRHGRRSRLVAAATALQETEVEVAAKAGALVPDTPEEPEPAPERGLMVALVAAAYVVWTMDKVNMSVAVIPMSAQFAWDSAEVGLIQSAIFWGYAATQVVGGFLSTRFGGKRVLLGAVVLWSLMTVLAPLAAAQSTEVFIASRVLVGIGEGLAPAAGIRIVATWVPEAERSRAVATLGSGKNAGSIFGLLLAPVVIGSLGWPSMFYSFGALGLLWAAVWAVLGKDREEPKAEQSFTGEEKQAPIPWVQILSSPPLWGVVAAHFCHDWGMYALLTWTPLYLNRALGFNLEGSSETTVIPSVLAVATAVFAGTMADRLHSNGMELTAVRKTMQTLGFVIPALSIGLLGAIGTEAAAQMSPLLPVALLTVGIAGGSFSLAGLYSSHADLNAKYSGMVNGISTTFGALAGVCSNAYAGQTLAATNSWSQAIFLPSVAFYVIGCALYLALYDATPIDWDKAAQRAGQDSALQDE